MEKRFVRHGDHYLSFLNSIFIFLSFYFFFQIFIIYLIILFFLLLLMIIFFRILLLSLGSVHQGKKKRFQNICIEDDKKPDSNCALYRLEWFAEYKPYFKMVHYVRKKCYRNNYWWGKERRKKNDNNPKDGSKNVNKILKTIENRKEIEAQVDEEKKIHSHMIRKPKQCGHSLWNIQVMQAKTTAKLPI